jgi:FeS assembly protein SufD
LGDYMNKTSEPQWLVEYRSAARRAFESATTERSRYIAVPTAFSSLIKNNYSIDPQIPENIQSMLNDKSQITILQVNNEIVKISVPGTLEEKGLVVSELSSAIKTSENDIKNMLSLPEKKTELLNAAHFESGIYIAVPDKFFIETPIRYFLMVTPGTSVVTRTIITVGNNSSVRIDEYDFSQEGEDARYNNITNILTGKNSNIDYTVLQNFGKNVTNIVSRRASIDRSSKINWIVGNLGSGTTMGTRNTFLSGEFSKANDTEIFFGDDVQQFDMTANIHHVVPNTRAKVDMRGILRGRSKSVSRGMVTIEPAAQKTETLLSEHTLMLDPETRSNAIPGLEIEANDVKASHSASTSHIDYESVFYLMSRGIDEENAKKLVAMGFLSSAFKKLPRDMKKMLKIAIIEKWNRKSK